MILVTGFEFVEFHYSDADYSYNAKRLTELIDKLQEEQRELIHGDKISKILILSDDTALNWNYFKKHLPNNGENITVEILDERILDEEELEEILEEEALDTENPKLKQLIQKFQDIVGNESVLFGLSLDYLFVRLLLSLPEKASIYLFSYAESYVRRQVEITSISRRDLEIYKHVREIFPVEASSPKSKRGFPQIGKEDVFRKSFLKLLSVKYPSAEKRLFIYGPDREINSRIADEIFENNKVPDYKVIDCLKKEDITQIESTDEILLIKNVDKISTQEQHKLKDIIKEKGQSSIIFTARDLIPLFSEGFYPIETPSIQDDKVNITELFMYTLFEQGQSLRIPVRFVKQVMLYNECRDYLKNINSYLYLKKIVPKLLDESVTSPEFWIRIVELTDKKNVPDGKSVKEISVQPIRISRLEHKWSVENLPQDNPFETFTDTVDDDPLIRIIAIVALYKLKYQVPITAQHFRAIYEEYIKRVPYEKGNKDLKPDTDEVNLLKMYYKYMNKKKIAQEFETFASFFEAKGTSTDSPKIIYNPGIIETDIQDEVLDEIILKFPPDRPNSKKSLA